MLNECTGALRAWVRDWHASARQSRKLRSRVARAPMGTGTQHSAPPWRKAPVAPVCVEPPSSAMAAALEGPILAETQLSRPKIGRKKLFDTRLGQRYPWRSPRAPLSNSFAQHLHGNCRKVAPGAPEAPGAEVWHDFGRCWRKVHRCWKFTVWPNSARIDPNWPI